MKQHKKGFTEENKSKCYKTEFTDKNRKMAGNCTAEGFSSYNKTNEYKAIRTNKNSMHNGQNKVSVPWEISGWLLSFFQNANR